MFIFYAPKKISTWQQFAREVRSSGCDLLRELDKFSDAVFVAGCQRSGTTILARTLFQSEGMANYWVGKDDELDAALILSGAMNHTPQPDRYCFQTTYLNECYTEYLKHRGKFKLIWVIRNPISVVYSMLYNWGRFAFNELFNECGVPVLDERDKERFKRFGRFSLSRIRRACFAYTGKTNQLFELKDWLGDKYLFVVDYDDLVANKTKILPEIYSFIEQPYSVSYSEAINARSVDKAFGLSDEKKVLINELCGETYNAARKLLTPK